MNDDKKIDVNEKNSEDYEKLMKASSTDVDRYYWDRKNPAVRILLMILFAIVILGSIGIFIWAGLF